VKWSAPSQPSRDFRLKRQWPQPETLQNYTIFATGRPIGAKEPEAVTAFLDFLKSPAAIAAMKAKGMQVD
jgi:hypothetical protein